MKWAKAATVYFTRGWHYSSRNSDTSTTAPQRLVRTAFMLTFILLCLSSAVLCFGDTQDHEISSRSHSGHFESGHLLLYWIASGTVKRARIRHLRTLGRSSEPDYEMFAAQGVREDTVVLSGINKAAGQADCTAAQGVTWGSPTCKRVLSSAMVHFVGPRQILLLTFTVAILGLTAASHFRGGTIQWKSLNSDGLSGEVSATL